MSVRTMARVWADSRHAGTELLMLLAIADFADDDGNAYPAVGTLAAKCRMKPRNANYILSALQASGELRVMVSGGPRGTNRYRIVLEALGVQPGAGVQSAAGVQHSARTPAMQCSKPLQPIADKPSENHQEPSERDRSAKKRRIPDDWKPSDSLTAWVKEKRPDLNVAAVAEIFRDHYIGTGEARASWDASFRTWVRREREAVSARRRPTSHSGFDKLDYSADIGPNGELL